MLASPGDTANVTILPYLHGCYLCKTLWISESVISLKFGIQRCRRRKGIRTWKGIYKNTRKYLWTVKRPLISMLSVSLPGSRTLQKMQKELFQKYILKMLQISIVSNNHRKLQHFQYWEGNKVFSDPSQLPNISKLSHQKIIMLPKLETADVYYEAQSALRSVNSNFKWIKYSKQ